MSDDFYPVPELDGSPPAAPDHTPHGGARWLARFGLGAGSLVLAFGIGAFGAGHLTTAGHEPEVSTTQGSGQDAAPAQQPGAAVRAPAGESGDED